MQGNSSQIEPLGSLFVRSPSTLTIRNSQFLHRGFGIFGHLSVDRCRFLASGPGVTGGIDLSNSVIISSDSSPSGPLALEISSDRDVQLDFTSTIINTTFVAGEVRLDQSSIVDHNFDGNIFYKNTRIDSGAHFSFEYNLFMPSVNLGGVGNTTGDPLFVDEANNDFHLRPGSPAIDAGDPATPPGSRDLDGVVRPQGTRADIGALEFVP